MASASASRLRRWDSFTEDFKDTVPSMIRISFIPSRILLISMPDRAAQVPLSMMATERFRRPWHSRSRRKSSMGV